MGNSNSNEAGFFSNLGKMCGSCNICLRPELQSPELQQHLSLYEGISLCKDLYYGEGYVMKKKQDQFSYILLKKTVEIANYPTKLAVLQQLKKCSDGPANKNIISTNLIADIQKSGFMSKSRQLYVVHDMILTDLQRQFQFREKNSRDFNEDQIKTIIKQCTKGYLRLQLTDYNSVRLNHIYFCGSGSDVKVAHPKLFNYEPNYRIALRDYNQAKKMNLYLSPQQMSALQKSNQNYTSGWVSNSYSFGIIILSMMKMKDLGYVYNYRDCSIDFDEIDKLTRECNGKYSFHLVNIIQDLLKLKQGQRLTFKGLLNRIQSNQPLNKFMDLLVVNVLGNNRDQKPIEKQEAQQVKLNLKQPIPKYPNYIAAFLKPKISMTGEYIRLDSEEPHFNKFTTDAVVANQRLRYSDQTTARASVGSYIGQVLNLQKLKENQPVREGKGLYQNADGQIYIGDWHKGKMQGYGKLYYNSKKLRYEGQFKNGLFHGKGVEYSQGQIPQRQNQIQEQYIRIFKGNWIRYDGYYVEDRRSGAGKVFFSKGCWKGNFKNGQPNGQGAFYSYVTNKETRGLWKDGELMSNK